MDDAGNPTVTQATHIDGGVFAANKMRLKTPTLGSAMEIETAPADRPQDGTVSDSAHSTTGKGASEGAKLTQDGDPFQYDDEVWLAATLKNQSSADQGASNAASGQQGKEGALQHAKLVFSLYLPQQVTFYDEALLKNLGEDVNGANYEKLLTDYVGDNYSFYIERTYKDRLTDTAVTTGDKVVRDEFTGSAKFPKRSQQQTKYERLTPKQLVEAGWTLRVRVQPDYDADGYVQKDYAKGDVDDLDDLPQSPDVKQRIHGGEVVVFELTPPDDASDLEFVKHPSMLSAFWDNVRADGYVGPGDSITLKVRTRIDNVGDEESALEGLTDADGDALGYAQQLEAIRTWSAEASKAYFATENQDASWLPQATGWSHTFDEAVDVTIVDDADATSQFVEGDIRLTRDDAATIYVVNRDAEGRIVYDAEGNPTFTPILDALGAATTFTFEAGETYLKPTVAVDSVTSLGTDWFNSQSPSYFQWAAGSVLVDDKLSHVDPDTGEVVPDVDYDRDHKDTSGDERQKLVVDENGDAVPGEDGEDQYVSVNRGFPERHLASVSGTFDIRKPSASVRADTGAVRSPTDDSNAIDSTQSGSNDLYVTQAINTGAAVNSFIVDWQVPLWALGSQSSENAPLNSISTPVGRVTPSITSVKSGVWEIPGTYKWQVTNPVTGGDPVDTGEGTHYFKAAGTPDAGDEVGAWRVSFKNTKRIDGVTHYRYFIGTGEEDYAVEYETEADGTTKYEKDEAGKLILDDNGNPIPVVKYEGDGKTPIYRYVIAANARRVPVTFDETDPEQTKNLTPEQIAAKKAEAEEAAANRAIEEKLWVFVYVRRNVTDTKTAKIGRAHV